MLEVSKRRPASQGSRVATKQRPDHNVAAVFRDLSSARAAINALGRATIEANDISLTGPAADRAAALADTSQLDAHIAAFLGNRVALGAAIGAASGAIVGLFLALFALVVFGWDVSVATTLATMLFGAIGMSVLGGFVTGMYNLQPAEPWELTFEDMTGRAIVGVHSEDPKDIAKATQVLQDQRPIEIYRTDSHGRRI